MGDADVPLAKRARAGDDAPQQPPARRALSCTECKRRKTKCSALGKTPCDACIKRGKPGDCVWEGYDISDGQPRYALAADVDALRAEVEHLRRQVGTMAPLLTPPIAAPPASLSASPKLEYPHEPANGGGRFMPPPDEVARAVVGLEDEVVGPMPGSRTAHALRELSAQAGPELVRIHGLLPMPEVGGALVAEYFAGALHKGWHVVEQVSFYVHFAQFVAAGESADPAWLSLYLAMLALAAKFSPNLPALFPMQLPEHLPLLPHMYQQASLRALELADYLATPQIRHLQVALLYIQYFFHFGETSAQANIALRHLDAAVTTAQWLELDLACGSSVSRVPFDDPALADLQPAAAAEFCKRLVHTLSFLDGTIQKRPSLWRLGKIGTPLPQNYLNLTDMAQSPLPPHELTEASLSRIGSVFAVAIRGFPANQELSIERVAEFDRALQAPLDLIPIGHGTLDDMWMILLVFCSIHNRRLRAHRTYAMKDQSDPAHRAARGVCVESATRLISTLHLFNSNPRLRPNFTKRWIVGAALFLVVDLAMGATTSRVPLAQALEIFTAVDPHDARAKATAECARLVEVLLAVGDGWAATGGRKDIAGLFDDVQARFRSTPSSDLDFDALFKDFPLFDFNLVGFSQGI